MKLVPFNEAGNLYTPVCGGDCDSGHLSLTGDHALDRNLTELFKQAGLTVVDDGNGLPMRHGINLTHKNRLIQINSSTISGGYSSQAGPKWERIYNPDGCRTFSTYSEYQAAELAKIPVPVVTGNPQIDAALRASVQPFGFVRSQIIDPSPIQILDDYALRRGTVITDYYKRFEEVDRAWFVKIDEYHIVLTGAKPSRRAVCDQIVWREGEMVEYPFLQILTKIAEKTGVPLEI